LKPSDVTIIVDVCVVLYPDQREPDFSKTRVIGRPMGYSKGPNFPDESVVNLSMLSSITVIVAFTIGQPVAYE
jgi:hypothetical protein